MKLNDAVWGALFILFSAVLLIHVQGFPRIPGQQVGPALFPGFLAVALAVCGALLVVKGLAARRSGGGRPDWVLFSPRTRSRHHAFAFSLMMCANALYIFPVAKLGFIPTAVT